MNKFQNKIDYFQVRILNYYSTNGRHELPWRKRKLSAYKIIVSEILLQRTRAETINYFYKKFIKSYPNWKSILKGGLENLKKFLKPIGLYNQRAKRLMSLAHEMVSRKNKLPETREELEKIPFFGQYITYAIELQIFNRSSPLLDVNMARVLERFFEPRKLADIRYDPQLQSLAHKIVDHKKSKEISWGILDLASSICKVNSPNHFICPIKAKCSFYTYQLDPK